MIPADSSSFGRSDEHSFSPEVVFSADEWQLYTNILWDHADEASSVCVGLQSRLEEFYDELHSQGAARLNLHQQELHAEQVEKYWEMQRQLMDMKAREERLLTLLERIDEGTATPNQVLAVLPQSSSQEEQKQSKRKQAIQKEQERLGTDQREINWALFMTGVGMISVTDPRRIASGRNRTRLVSADGVSIYAAEGLFYEATADTHGGKVRNNGKSGSGYIGKSGRKIRKY